MYDCVVDDITIENQYIIFTFEQDISYHDSIKYIKPDAKSLVIKFHLADECFSLFKWHKPIKYFADNGYYKGIDSSELIKLTKLGNRLDYCYHYVAYQSLIYSLNMYCRQYRHKQSFCLYVFFTIYYIHPIGLIF